MFRNKTILVTGGTGTIGRSAVKLFLEKDAREIRVFSRDEEKQFVMKSQINDSRITYYLGDVRNADSIVRAMVGVDYVLHTAALKQVPILERFPMEALKTNIEGTNNLLDVAITLGIKKVICTSSDKAVYPVNAMGLSKAFMEKLICSKAVAHNNGTTIACLRLGNILGSRGSVVPTFISQAVAGEPLTVTEPNMTRFILSIEEVLSLIVHAFRQMENAEIIARKMSACRMHDLALAIGRIFCPDSAFNINIVGARPGEKEHEQLFTEEESRYIDDREHYLHFKRKTNHCGLPIKKSLSSDAAVLNLPQLISYLENTEYIRSMLKAHKSVRK